MNGRRGMENLFVAVVGTKWLCHSHFTVSITCAHRIVVHVVFSLLRAQTHTHTIQYHRVMLLMQKNSNRQQFDRHTKNNSIETTAAAANISVIRETRAWRSGKKGNKGNHRFSIANNYFFFIFSLHSMLEQRQKVRASNKLKTIHTTVLPSAIFLSSLLLLVRSTRIGWISLLYIQSKAILIACQSMHSILNFSNFHFGLVFFWPLLGLVLVCAPQNILQNKCIGAPSMRWNNQLTNFDLSTFSTFETFIESMNHMNFWIFLVLLTICLLRILLLWMARLHVLEAYVCAASTLGAFSLFRVNTSVELSLDFYHFSRSNHVQPLDYQCSSPFEIFSRHSSSRQRAIFLIKTKRDRCIFFYCNFYYSPRNSIHLSIAFQLPY